MKLVSVVPVPCLVASFIFTPLIGLTACGGGGASGGSTSIPPVPTPTVTTNSAVTAKSLYATNTETSTVDVYTANQSGAVSTTATISVGIHLPPHAIAADSSGNLYVGVDTTTGGQVSVFSSGAATPSRTITLPNPGDPYSNQIASMTTDSLDNLYVAGAGSSSSAPAIYVYAPGATGAAAPLRTISGTATTLMAGTGTTGVCQMALDSKDNLYIAQGGYGPNGNVVMFPAGANGNVAPTLITSSTYSPTGVTLDAQDNIYISQGEIGTHTVADLGKYPTAIYVFAKGSVAGATPTRTITGSATGMFISLYNIHVDSAGNIFVEQNAQGYSQFLVYDATANGNVAPSSTLAPKRGLSIDTQFYLK